MIFDIENSLSPIFALCAKLAKLGKASQNAHNPFWKMGLPKDPTVEFQAYVYRVVVLGLWCQLPGDAWCFSKQRTH